MRLIFIICFLSISSIFTNASDDFLSQEELLNRLIAEDEVTYEPFVNQIVYAVASQMERELGLQCTGTAGTWHDKVKQFGLSFRANRRATIEEARALHLYVLNQLISAINNHVDLQPYLIERPFNFKHVTVNLNFYGPNGRFNDGTVAFTKNVGHIAGHNHYKLMYDTHDVATNRFVDLYEEMVEEAIEKAKIDNITFPFEHKSTELEETIDSLFAVYVEKLRKLGLRCMGIGGDLSHGVDEVGVRLNCFDRADEITGRELMVKAVEPLLKAINESSQLRPYLKEYPFGANRLKIQMDFTRSDYIPYTEGSLHHIKMADDMLTYYKKVYVGQGNPKKKAISSKMLVAANESYPEALHTVESSSFVERFYHNLWILISGLYYFFLDLWYFLF